MRVGLAHLAGVLLPPALAHIGPFRREARWKLWTADGVPARDSPPARGASHPFSSITHDWMGWDLARRGSHVDYHRLGASDGPRVTGVRTSSLIPRYETSELIPISSSSFIMRLGCWHFFPRSFNAFNQGLLMFVDNNRWSVKWSVYISVYFSFPYLSWKLINEIGICIQSCWW